MHSIYEIASPGIDSRFGLAHAEVWQELGACGTWWTGSERVQAMKEARGAYGCDLCSRRKHDSIPPSDEMTSEGRLTLANWREFRICLLGIQISRPGHHGNRIVLAENYRFVDQ